MAGRRRGMCCRLCGMVLCMLAGWLFSVADAHGFDEQAPVALIRDLRIGMALHDVDGLWSGESKESGPDICAEVTLNRPLFALLGGTALPNFGVTINTRGNTSKVYGGFRLEWLPLPALMVSTGLGLTVHDGKRDTDRSDRKSLGSNVLFRVPIEIGWVLSARYRIVLAFDHISNAYLFSPNEGMDTLGLMVGYRF